jgi:hypothetical protein
MYALAKKQPQFNSRTGEHTSLLHIISVDEMRIYRPGYQPYLDSRINILFSEYPAQLCQGRTGKHARLQESKARGPKNTEHAIYGVPLLWNVSGNGPLLFSFF